MPGNVLPLTNTLSMKSFFHYLTSPVFLCILSFSLLFVGIWKPDNYTKFDLAVLLINYYRKIIAEVFPKEATYSLFCSIKTKVQQAPLSMQL